MWGFKGFLDRVALGFARSVCIESIDIWRVAFPLKGCMAL